MIEWLKQLPPEFYITTGLLLLLLIFAISLLAVVVSVNRRLGKQDFEILESIVKDATGSMVFNFTVSNRSFSTNYINIIGFKNANITQILEEKNISIAPRTKSVSSFPMTLIESYTIETKGKFKKILLFAENEIGLRQETKAKLLNKYLKRRLKKIKKQARKDAKAKRFETGNYNFFERVGLIIRLFFRPLYKLFQLMKRSTNRSLKEIEVRRKQKAEHDKIERELSDTVAKVNEIKIIEESYKENKTRETILENLKQKKILEIEKLKQEAYDQAFEKKKEEILAIDSQAETDKYFAEHPLDYEEIEAKVKEEIKTEKQAQAKKDAEAKKQAEEKAEKLEKEKLEKEKAEKALAEEKPKDEPQEEKLEVPEDVIKKDLEEKEVKKVEKPKKEEPKKEQPKKQPPKAAKPKTATGPEKKAAPKKPAPKKPTPKKPASKK